MNKEKTGFTKKELNAISWRWTLYRCICFNYEKMEAQGYLVTMLPAINKLYGGNEEERKLACRVHNEFFNCETNLANLILGIDLAIEEEYGSEGLDMSRNVKTSLMGPLSGIGDTLFTSVIMVIFGSIAVTLALQGNLIGWVIWQIEILLETLWLRPWLIREAYKKGVDLAGNISGKLKALTDCGSILGLTVIGAMCATMVTVKFGSVAFEGFTFDFQTQFFDAIMPKAGSAMLVALCYWLLGKKVKAGNLIWIIIVASIVLAWLGIIVY